MTFVETILGGLMVALFAGLIGSVLTGRDKVSVEDLEKHKDAIAPHPACPAHATKLDIIEKKLDHMDSKLDSLIGR